MEQTPPSQFTVSLENSAQTAILKAVDAEMNALAAQYVTDHRDQIHSIARSLLESALSQAGSLAGPSAQ